MREIRFRRVENDANLTDTILLAGLSQAVRRGPLHTWNQATDPKRRNNGEDYWAIDYSIIPEAPHIVGNSESPFFFMTEVVTQFTI